MHLIIVYVKYLQSVFEWQKERTKPKQQRKKKKYKTYGFMNNGTKFNHLYTLCNTQSKWKPIYKHNCDGMVV